MLNSIQRFPFVLVSAIVFMSVVSQPAIADAQGYSHYGGGWGHMAFGSSMMIIALALVVFLVVLAVRRFGGNPQRTEITSSALDILRERYARGEIDKDEYEERLAVLSKP